MLSVLRGNPMFRRLWRAQVVSQLGDWFNRLAALSLIGELGGKSAITSLGALFGVEVAFRFLPSAFLGGLAGPAADRLPRKHIMIVADLLRAALVLALLLVRGPEHLPLLFGLLIAQMAVSIFFDSARAASVPSTLDPKDLHLAYALTSATWSTMLTVGALLGGVCVELVGTRGVFVIDSLTYLVSAWILLGLRLPQMPRHPQPFRWRDIFLFRDLRRGLAHVSSLGISPVILAKAAWGGAGGFLVIIGISGRIQASDSDASTSGLATGLLYAARGVGTALGPILGRAWIGSSDRGLRRQISAGFFVGAAGYALFAFSPRFEVAILFVGLAHLGGSALWVSSTTFWQRRVENAFRGRVHAVEFMAMTLSTSVFAVVAGLVYDHTRSIRTTTLIVCAIVVTSGTVWAVRARDLASDQGDHGDQGRGD